MKRTTERGGPFKAVLACSFAVATLGCNDQPELGRFANMATATKIRTALVGDAATADVGEEEATGTGWATLRGRFIFEGEPPQMPPYQVNKDAATCAPGGQPPLQEFLLVDSATKGIANVAIYPRRVSRVHESAVASGGDPVVFDQEKCVFLTHVATVNVGQSLDIRNSDDVGHNTNIAGQNSFNQTIPSGGSTMLKIKKEEALPASVRCSIHPWMLAYLLPRNNTYVAVTKPDGSFEISNLPAGEELELQVWHEAAAGGKGALYVENEDAKALEWDSKGRFKITLEPDKTKELEIVVPASAFGT